MTMNIPRKIPTRRSYAPSVAAYFIAIFVAATAAAFICQELAK